MELTENEKKLLLLLSKEEGYKPAKYFSEEMGYSSKTIYQLCTSISEKLTSELTAEVISRLPRNGIKLVYSFSEIQELFYSTTATPSLSHETKYSKGFRKIFLLLDLLITGEIAHFDYYGELFYVSEMTIQKDYTRLLQLLESNGINLTKKGRKITANLKELNASLAMIIKKVVMESAEKNVVSFDSYIKLYSEVKEVSYYYQLFKSVSEFCQQSYSEHSPELQNHHLQSLTLSIYFYLISRSSEEVSHGNSLADFSAAQLDQLEWYVYVLAFTKSLNEDFAIALSQKDIQQICHFLVMHGFDFTAVAGDATDPRIAQSVTELIIKLSNYLALDLTHNEKLQQSLLKHIAPMIERLQHNIYIKNPIVNLIKKQYSSVFQLISIAVGELEKRFGILLNEDENAFLTIHFQVAIEAEVDVKHVFVVCKQGLLTSELIYNRLSQVLPKNTMIELITTDQLAQLTSEKVDLVVSSVKIATEKFKTCYVSVLPSDEELKKVVEALFEVDTRKNKRALKAVRQGSIFSQFILAENVFLKADYKNKEALFHFLAEEFSRRKISKINIESELNKREQLGYTSLNTGIAIPHVAPHLIERSTVIFVTLEKPIQWGYNKVSLVLLLALKEADVLFAKDIIEEIQEVIESSERIEAISQSQNYREFKEKLLVGEGASRRVQ